jgi:hypothetical protein
MEIDRQALKVAKEASLSEFKPSSLTPEKNTITAPTEKKNEYSLGIKPIDKQHQMIMFSFANIENSIHSKLDWSTIHYSILELKELSLRHFAVVDALMELFGYP